MTELDDDLVPALADMAEELGKVVSVVAEDIDYTEGTGEGVRTPGSPISVKLLGLEPVADQYIAAGTYEQGDARGLFAAQGLGFTPTKGDRVTIDSVEWTTIEVRAIYTGELIGAYQVYLRRG